MNVETLEKLFSVVLNEVSDSIIWRLEGSVNLFVQGINTTFKDLDITTDSRGMEFFREKLKQYILKDYFNETIKTQIIVCNIFNEEVEILFYQDKELRMFNNVEELCWKNYDLKVLPLVFAKKFYQIIGKEKKVKLIEENCGDKS